MIWKQGTTPQNLSKVKRASEDMALLIPFTHGILQLLYNKEHGLCSAITTDWEYHHRRGAARSYPRNCSSVLKRQTQHYNCYNCEAKESVDQ